MSVVSFRVFRLLGVSEIVFLAQGTTIFVITGVAIPGSPVIFSSVIFNERLPAMQQTSLAHV